MAVQVFLGVCLLDLHNFGVFLTSFFFNSLQEGVPAGVVGRQKNTVTLGLTEGTLLPVVPLARNAGPGETPHCLSFLVQYVFSYQDRDIFGCMADIGWITGHTYVVYGPLCNGGTTVLFESTPVYPNPGE